MLQATLDNVLIKVKTRYIGNISNILKMSAIQNISSVDPSQFVNIMGEVVSVPQRITNKRENIGFSTDNIKVGDTAIFSYLVIYDVFTEDENKDPVFRNLIPYKGQDIFAVDIKNVFAVIREGEIIMLNGYVMVTDYEQSNIVLPQHMRRLKKAAKCEIMHIGKPKDKEPILDANVGDTVYFNPFIGQKYQISGKKFCIINQRQILGKKIS